jgi:hypothetical protein
VGLDRRCSRERASLRRSATPGLVSGRMKQIATLTFDDLDSRDEACAVVRAALGSVALALTLRENVDLEAVMAVETSRQLADALAEAARVAELPGE